MFVEVARQSIAEQALRGYGKRLEESRETAVKGLVRPAFATVGKHEKGTAQLHCDDNTLVLGEVDVLAELTRDMAMITPNAQTSTEKTATVDGERVLLCKECSLPVGEIVYGVEAGGEDGAFLHGECKAQCMLREMRKNEEDRKAAAARLKRARRAEFEIGWRPSAIPESTTQAAKVSCAAEVPEGLCCLIAAEDGAEARVAATLEPAAAVNLEYLAIALQVRRSEGREPLFSLDPVENGKVNEHDPEAAMQQKRFEPEWLAGTSVGEVMFQADYHLKELSFGEFPQPVVGMKSCLDHSEADTDDTDWSAREWFVVRKAEVHMSDDKVIVPHLKMGVEAREQIMGDDGLEDAPITRPDHPLVKYADEFTHNFDLIAERKSVVFQLREVAKASIMAKYLLDSCIHLAESWFGVAPEDSKAICCWEVPQLWNDRCTEKLAVKDGMVEPSKDSKIHGIYGGVDFGIDRFRLSAPSRVATSVVAGRAVLGRPATSLMASTRTGMAVGPARQFARLSAPLSATMSMAASRAGLGAPRVAAGLSMGTPQGVDLNLDKFNLSAPLESGSFAGSLQADDARLSIGGCFWNELEQGKTLQGDDRSLLMDIFHPHLSDRREDGELFVPPPTHSPHMTKLKQLIKSERVVREQRKDHFLGTAFRMDFPGPLFPTGWTVGIQLAMEHNAAEQLQPRPDYLAAERGFFTEIVKVFAPTFDRITEDGARFRIYRLGGLEIRTMQEHGAEEELGAVFTVATKQCAAAEAANVRSINDADVVIKVTEFVERVPGSDDIRLYVVAETAAGDIIVTEKPQDFGATWVENPLNIDRRNALARAIRSRGSGGSGGLRTFLSTFGLSAYSGECGKVTVGELREWMAHVDRNARSPVHYAQMFFLRAAGVHPNMAAVPSVACGFVRAEGSSGIAAFHKGGQSRFRA